MAITYKTKLLLTAEDEDNASGKEVTGTFRAGYNKYTKKVGWSVTVAASYARENGGCFTIHNRLVDAATKLVVTFDCAGAGSIPIQLVDEGSRVVKPDDPRLEGYIFDGWFKVADNGKSVETERYDFTTPVTTDMTLKAGFQEAEGLGSAPEDEIYPEEVQLLLDAGLSATWKGSKVKATWGEVPGATKYVLYAAYCGKKYKKVKTVKGLTATIRKLNGKKLNRKKSVKLYVVAYAGSKKLGRSISAHAAGPENAKYTNASKIRVTKAKISIANGTGRRIRSKVTRADTSKALPKYCAPTFRYASSDEGVASVSDAGRIRANGTGSCVVYVYAQNGISAKVKVTVR